MAIVDFEPACGVDLLTTYNVLASRVSTLETRLGKSEIRIKNLEILNGDRSERIRKLEDEVKDAGMAIVLITASLIGQNKPELMPAFLEELKKWKETC